MNLFEVVEKANGGEFHRKSEPYVVYQIRTRTANHSGALFEYSDLWTHIKHTGHKEFCELSFPRIMADDWEVIDEKVVE